MTWPDPRPGLVFRYAYLWLREADAGREEGVKDRPCAIILAVQGEAGETTVYALPITHAPPREPDDAIELPTRTKNRLGLDSGRSWVVISEVNRFIWPGPDLRPEPGRGPQSVAYGTLPPAVFNTIKQRFLTRVRDKRSGIVPRSE